MVASYEHSYFTFVTALSMGEHETMRSLVTDSFTANLPGTGILTFDDFIREIERQRGAFSDLGRQVTFHHIASGYRLLFVHYSMNVAFDGVLRGAFGEESRGSNQQVFIKAVDVVRFGDEDKIDSLETISDRLTTVEQMR